MHQTNTKNDDSNNHKERKEHKEKEVRSKIVFEYFTKRESPVSCGVNQQVIISEFFVFSVFFVVIPGPVLG